MKTKNMFRAVIISVVSIALILSLPIAGCKAGSAETIVEGSKEVAEDVTGEVSEKVAEETKEETFEGVTIYYITWADYTQEMLDLFKEQTGITLNYQQFGGDEYNEAVRTRVAGGGDLDVMAIRSEMRKEFFNDDLMVDLTGEPVLEMVKDYSTGTSSDGKVYGLPIGGFVEAVWYNKDIFKENNLSVPENWEEFNDVCKGLKKQV